MLPTRLSHHPVHKPRDMHEDLTGYMVMTILTLTGYRILLDLAGACVQIKRING